MNKSAPYLGNTNIKVFKPNRSIYRAYIHTKLFTNTMDLNQKALDKGLDCIEYHFTINNTGIIEYGRDINKLPYSQESDNEYTLSIVVSSDNPAIMTKAQNTALFNLCSLISKSIPGIQFFGYPEHSYTELLGLDSNNRMTNDIRRVLPTEPAICTLTNKQVIKVQKKLNLKKDGILGPVTWEALTGDK